MSQFSGTAGRAASSRRSPFNLIFWMILVVVAMGVLGILAMSLTTYGTPTTSAQPTLFNVIDANATQVALNPPQPTHVISSAPADVPVAPPVQPNPIVTPSSITDADIAILLTPVADTLSPADRVLFDTANGNTMGANSFDFSVLLGFRVQIGAESGYFDVQLDGHIGNIQSASLTSVGIDGIVNATTNLNGQDQEVALGVRLVDGILYIQNPEPVDGVEWIGIPFDALLESSLQVDALLDDSTSFATDDLGGLPDILNLFQFGRFVITTRNDVSPNEASFNSIIDVLGFVQSPLLDALLRTLNLLEDGIGLSDADIATAKMLFLMTVPELSLQIDHTVDIPSQFVKRAAIDFDATIMQPDAQGNPVATQIQVDLILTLSNPNITRTFTAPPNAQIQQLAPAGF